ncbi:hypothetical protein BC830DRAFT_1215789 [Chytriomyces sp. MP71]|nr:hypothetical protein BC830DRAFT_1215789 [Chytriomyces sp. MP71]
MRQRRSCVVLPRVAHGIMRADPPERSCETARVLAVSACGRPVKAEEGADEVEVWPEVVGTLSPRAVVLATESGRSGTPVWKIPPVEETAPGGPKAPGREEIGPLLAVETPGGSTRMDVGMPPLPVSPSLYPGGEGDVSRAGFRGDCWEGPFPDDTEVTPPASTPVVRMPPFPDEPDPQTKSA